MGKHALVEMRGQLGTSFCQKWRGGFNNLDGVFRFEHRASFEK